MSTGTSVMTAIDVRTIPPRQRHALIFQRFDDLKVGEAIELLNDHDPVPLRYQFEDRSPGSFAWRYLQAGPNLWQVQITKTQDDVSSIASGGSDSCCSGGACRG